MTKNWISKYQNYNFARKIEKMSKIDVFVIIMIKKVNPKLTVSSKLIVLVFRE